MIGGGLGDRGDRGDRVEPIKPSARARSRSRSHIPPQKHIRDEEHPPVHMTPIKRSARASSRSRSPIPPQKYIRYEEQPPVHMTPIKRSARASSRSRSPIPPQKYIRYEEQPPDDMTPINDEDGTQPCGRQKIIEELQRKGRYDKWKKLGSKFGLTSKTLELKLFSVRPFMYYDVDENIVKVSMVTSTYDERPNVDNIAVFEYVKDPTYVDQSKYRIVNMSESLSTNGLLTCTGLAMIIGTKKFMTHLDAQTPIHPIIYAIGKIISTERIRTDSLKPIIYAGPFDSDITLEKAKEICSTVGIPQINYDIRKVCMTDQVRI